MYSKILIEIILFASIKYWETFQKHESCIRDLFYLDIEQNIFISGVLKFSQYHKTQTIGVKLL
jgi:hypothetical protein